MNLTLCVVTSKTPPVLSKGFTLAEDGSLQKHSGGLLVEGTTERRTLTLAEFCTLLAELKPNQALTYGVCGYESARIVPQSGLRRVKASHNMPTIARTRENFSWPDGAGVLMLDYDPPKDATALTREMLLEVLYSVWPELKDHPHVWTTSASSCIYRTDTGEEIRGVMGQRVYVPVADAQDIPRVGAVLFNRLWLAGYGRFEVSASGSLMDRTILDGTVWQPERLDFAGGAHCGAGLEQRRPDPILFNSEAAFIDSRSFSDLSSEETGRIEALRTEARLAMQSAAAAKQAEWIEDRLKTVPNGKKKEMREVFHRAVTQKRLLGDFVLHLEKFGKVSVAEILDNSNKFHGAHCADPLEPGYNNDGRIARVNLKAAGKSYLFSYAHGGQRFTLHRAMQTVRLEGGELQGIVEKVLGLMSLDGVVFSREGELVRLTDGVAYPVTADWLQWYLAGLVRFERHDRRSESWKVVDCPLTLARSICALAGNWHLPVLEGVLTSPSMTDNGRVIQEDGFDSQSGLYLHFPTNEEWRPIGDQSDPQNALACLWKPFGSFPFVSSVDRGGFLAALLTALVRPLLLTAPAFIISAPVAGSGKTLLALCVAALAGATAGVSSAGRDEEEVNKSLLTELRAFARCIIFDNLARPLESESLCSFLTSPLYRGRLLGTNSNIAGRPVAIVILTGNNPTIIGDLNRRLIRINIDPACEKPFDRRFDLDPLRYIEEHRVELVRAGLVVLKAALASGFKHNGGRLASFEAWSDFIRNAVIWIGENKWLDVDDPALSIESSFALDPETTRLKNLIFEWNRIFGKRGGTVAEAIRRANEDSDFFDVLNEISGERDKIPPRRLGNWIARHEGRIVAGSRFVRCGTYQNNVLWTVKFGEFGDFGEFQESFYPTREKMQSDKYIEQGKITHQTNETNEIASCDACVNFQSNTTDPQTKPGICDCAPDGRFAKFPTDGAVCDRFEQVTH